LQYIIVSHIQLSDYAKQHSETWTRVKAPKNWKKLLSWWLWRSFPTCPILSFSISRHSFSAVVSWDFPLLLLRKTGSEHSANS